MREMKDSGVEWIREVPKSWQIVKLKYLTTKVDRGTAPEYIENEGTKVVNQATFSRGFFDTKNIRFSSKPAGTSRGLLKKHDVLLASTGGGVLGKTHYFNENDVYVADGHVTVIRTIHEILSPKILYYYFSVNYETFNCMMSEGSTNQTELQRDLLLNMCVPVPPCSEQHRIASYLDRKCSEIDDLMADIEKQIETLEQYKRSVITEAVTKGLKPDVEMKDSGIEWIGKVPNHWQIKRIKHLFSLRAEKNYKPLEEVQLLSLYTGIGVFPHGEREERGNKAVKAEGYSIVKKNDIVVNIILAWMGAIGISDYDGVTSPAYDVYKPNSDMTNPRFYHYVFQTQGIASECYRYGRGIMMMRWRTYSSEFKQIQIPFPPVAEQQAIADYLDSKCAEIESIIADKQKQLDTLAEYKKSLIYEYVTGKKEVEVDE